MDSLVKCSHCGKEVTRGYLDTHYRTHTGEKPFNCPRCSFKSAHESALKTHLLVGKRTPEECPHCDFKSCNHQALVKHKGKVHPNWTEPVKLFEKLLDAPLGGIESTDPPLKAIEFLQPKSGNPTEKLPFNINSSSGPPKETSDLGLQGTIGASNLKRYRLEDAMPLKTLPSKNPSEWVKSLAEIDWKVEKPSKSIQITHKKVETETDEKIKKIIAWLVAIKYFDCKFCDFRCYDSPEFEQHLVSRRAGSLLQCDQCVFRSCTKSYLETHVRDLHQRPNHEIKHMNSRNEKICPNPEKAGTPPPVLRKYNDGEEMLVDQDMEDTTILYNSEEPTLPGMKCLDCDLTFNNDHLLEEHKIHEHKSHLLDLPITETNESSKNIENRKKDESAIPFGKELRENLARLNLSKAAKSQSKNNVCQYCHKTFEHPCSLHTHIRAHTGEKPFKCNRCSFATAHQSRLFSHKQSTESRNGKFNYCSKPDCDFKSCTSHFLQMHLKEAHSGSVFEKPGQPLLVKQLKERDNEDEFQNIEHVGPFPSLPNPEIRIQEDKEYKCQKCSYCTNYKHKLEIHMAFSEKNAEFQACPKCDLTSCTRQYLQVHMTKKHKFESIAQNERNNSPTLRKLRSSAQDQDPSNSKEESVKTSGKRRSLISDSYAQAKLFQCERCCYSTNMVSSLEDHMMSWSRPGHKLHRCSHCDFISCTTKDLAAHQKEIHLNKIPISFSQMTPEAMLVCRYCKKEFTGSSRIKHHGDHVRIHTGEKPYKCSQCSFAAAQSSTLRSHMLRSNGVVHHCSYCDFTSCTGVSLRKHISDFHLQGTSSTPQHIEVSAADSEKSASEKYQHNLDFNLMPPKALDDSLIGNAEHRTVAFPFMKKLTSISKAKSIRSNGMRFRRENIRRLRSKQQQLSRRFECGYCSYRALDKNRLIIHERSHTGEKPYQCQVCGEKFSQKGSLYRHKYKRVKCTPNSSKIQADFQPFDTIRKVESLANQPTQQSSQMLEYLDSTLIGKLPLQSDTTMITENSSQSPMVSEIDLWNQPELPRIIPEDLATSQQNQEISNDNNNKFSQPQLIITGTYSLNDIPRKSQVSKKKKLFRCDICNFKTPHQGSLDIHTRIHTGDKPYKCYICPHRSARRHDMKLHEKTHGPRAEFLEIQA